MQPNDFIRKWKAVELSERAAAHSHFIDLCALLNEDSPTDADQRGTWYCFEKGAVKTTGAPGWADVWKRGCFGWEYKKKRRDLTAAFAQLQQYAITLENPPLLIVSDIDRIEVHTNWTNTVSEIYPFSLDDLRDAKSRELLKCAWSDPERFAPGKTRAELTEEAAAQFAALAERLRGRGHAPDAVAHFVNRLVFCMFAEDAELLPNRMFKRMLEQARRDPDAFPLHGGNLFRAMKGGGWIGFEQVDWFNGGLFDDDTVIPLDGDDVALVQSVAALTWSAIDTSIFGTLFERGLNPDKRSQLGAHYTDHDKIMMIVKPVIIDPLLAEWESTKAAISSLLVKPRASRNVNQPNLATATYRTFVNKLRAFRALDPACGSGNFLYVALLALKDIEHRVSIEAEALGIEREFPQIGPESVKGIEKNSYAAELARVTVWIGEIQWMRRNGFDVSRNPILKPLDTIECRDAILDRAGMVPEWPTADVVIGNPPFLGDKEMIGGLGEKYVGELRNAYIDGIPGSANLVTYWFERARRLIVAGGCERAGLVATQAIRHGSNRTVLDTIKSTTRVFEAWSNEPWVVDGAAVRVSLVCFGHGDANVLPVLDGLPVAEIYSDLSAGEIDLTRTTRLTENAGICWQGTIKVGNFDVDAATARVWLGAPRNPNGRPNSDVVRPWLNGSGITDRNPDRWIIDFGCEMSETQAALYEVPFRHVFERVKPVRDKVRREGHRRYWWRHAEARPGMRRALSGLQRYIATPRVSKHRVFVWVPATVVPDSRVNVIAREDDTTFGLLQSRFHAAWSLALGSRHGDGDDGGRLTYNNENCFGTFPFPDGLVPNRSAEFYAADPRAIAIANAARRLDGVRSNWLNPVDADVEVLRDRTLTNLYNSMEPWLSNAHRDLDQAVAAAYGWPLDISDDDAVKRLFALNLARTEAQRQRAPDRARTAKELQTEPELGLGVFVSENDEPSAADELIEATKKTSADRAPIPRRGN